MSILVVGSVALDTISTPFGETGEVLGGSATYFSCAASLFAPVRLLAAVGADFPDEFIHLLKKRGIDIQGLSVLPGETFRWQGSYAENLKEAETISVSLNVMADFVPRVPVSYQDSTHIFLANSDPQVQAKVLEQVSGTRLVVCDTMNHWINSRLDSLRQLWKRVDIVLLNDEEARLFTGEKHLLAAAEKILKEGPRAIVIKKGADGALLMSGEGLFLTPAYPTLQVCDPTGAGDSFGGGLMGYLAASGDTSFAGLRKAVVYGTAVASFTVEDFSLRRLLKVSRSEIEERVNQLRQITDW